MVNLLYMKVHVWIPRKLFSTKSNNSFLHYLFFREKKNNSQVNGWLHLFDIPNSIGRIPLPLQIQFIRNDLLSNVFLEFEISIGKDKMETCIFKKYIKNVAIHVICRMQCDYYAHEHKLDQWCPWINHSHRKLKTSIELLYWNQAICACLPQVIQFSRQYFRFVFLLVRLDRYRYKNHLKSVLAHLNFNQIGLIKTLQVNKQP